MKVSNSTFRLIPRLTNTGVRSLALAVTALSLAGCLQTRETQKEQEEKQVLKKQLTNLQQSTADVSTRFQDLEEEDRRLNGRVEALEVRLQQVGVKADKAGNVADSKFKENDAAYREEFSKLHAEIKGLRDQMALMQEETRKAAQVRERARAEASEAAKASDKNPYKVAEDHFAKKEWKDAAFSYDKYRTQNPKGKMFAMATYKMGVCFQELGMNDEATAFYEEVIAKFPKSKEAEKSSTRLKKLKAKK